MGLQAYIDDSKEGEDVLILAGYVAPYETWETFSRDWRELLREAPEWPEFKMKKAGRRNLARAEKFYRLIERDALIFVVCAVEIAPLRQLCEELELPAYFANPYIFAVRAIIDATAQRQGGLGIRQPIEFIFDKRTERALTDETWERWKASVHADMGVLFASKPRYEDSHTMMPLQADDLLAWHARKHWIKHGTFTAPLEISWPKMRAIPGDKVQWNYEGIRQNLLSLRDLLRRMGFAPPAPTTGDFAIELPLSSFFPKT